MHLQDLQLFTFYVLKNVAFGARYPLVVTFTLVLTIVSLLNFPNPECSILFGVFVKIIAKESK